MKLPEEMPHLFAEYWNSRDAKGLSELFDQDASFVNVVGLWWNSREQILKAHDYGLKVIFPDSRLTVFKVRTRHLTEDVAIVNARMMLEGQSPIKGEDSPGKRKNVFTFVLYKCGSEWICSAAHNTDVIPGAETNLVDSEGKLHPKNYRDNL